MTAQLDLADVIFLLDNVLIGSTPLPGADPFDPSGIRSIDGSFNNISGLTLFDQYGNFIDTATFGTVNQDFIHMTMQTSALAYAPGAVIMDSSPRIVSNLIVDQTASNPAAATATLLDPGDDTMDVRPVNSMFTFFGQFFDHGLDFIDKSGPGAIAIPLLPSDPLWVDPMSPGFIPGFTNMMFVSRAGVAGTSDLVNTTAPFIEQSQTYGSAETTTFYLKEYDAMGEATGDLVAGADGNMATWADIKANALVWAKAQAVAAGEDPNLVTEMITDADIGNIPDFNLWDPTLLNINGGTGAFSPGAGTGQAFLADIAHNANAGAFPNGPTPDADLIINPSGFGEPGPAPGEYDNELLDAHFIAGDPRANENVVLSSIHEAFHNEHSRILAQIQDWVAQEEILNPGFAAQWDGETYFEAAKFVNEMQYQHLVFEEFGRRMSPNIDEFGSYQVNINPGVTLEFSQAVYRLGHSMLTDTVKAQDVTGSQTNFTLIDAFLDPVLFADVGGADFAAGSQFEQGNRIDEFVVDSLRNFLVGLPLDLAAINIARGRDVGLPSLNQTREDLFAQTGEALLKPYESWDEFGGNLLNPASLVNFIAAYSQDAGIIAARNSMLTTAMDDARALAAAAIMDPMFMGVGGDQGFWDIDLWIGGLAEEKVPLGLLGSTFDFIFAQQMLALQDGDRFYYLGRIGGNFLDQIEAQTFADILMRGTGATHMYGDVFGTPDIKIELGTILQDNFTKTPAELAAIVHEIIGGTNASNTIDGGGGNDAIYGEGGNDTLDGGAADDHVYGGDGDDVIQGALGFDFLVGNDGDDEIHGGGDGDHVLGGRGDDTVFGDTGFDELLGNAGNDTIFGGNQDDAVLGGEGNDTLFGGNGNDGLEGGNGNDVMFGDAGDDDLVGAEGDDMLIGGAGGDALDGGVGGYDIASYETYNDGLMPAPGIMGLTINMLNTALSTGDARDDSYLGIEAVRGTNFDDIITGDDNSLVLVGGLGADTITGGLGDDVLIGSEGNDRLTGGGGNDTVLYRGLEADFTLAPAIGGLTVTDNNPVGFDEGVDFVSNDVTWINFDDSLLNLGTGLYAPLIGLSDTVERTQNGTNVIGEAVSTQVVLDGTAFTPAGIFISDIEISDPDGPNGGALVFSLAGDDALAFEILNIGGMNQLFLGTGAGLLGGATNFEVKPVYNVTVIVEDAIGSSALNLTVNVTDVNDNAPIFTSGNRVNVASGTNAAVIIYRAATDDLDTTGEAITYTLGGADAALFSLDMGGELRFLASPALGVPLDVGGDNVYNVTIDATDGVNAAATKDLSIHVAAGVILGTAGNDTLNGTAGDDIITALAGDDVVNGLAGDDLLNGGAGNDTLDGGADIDTATYTDALNSVDVYLQFTGIETGDGIDTLIDIENLTGSSFNDRVIGDMGDNTLDGGAGNDIIKGKGGNDVFFGGNGDDTIRGDAGNDVLFGGAGVDALFALGGTDTLNGGDDGDFLYGGQDADIVNGDAGDDVVKGNLGQDSLFGGAGVDDLRGGGGDDFMLDGGADNDFLFGEGGADTLHGGAGSDALSGGSGGGIGDGQADVFIFADSGSGSGGFDRIKDFENGLDVMDLTSFGFVDFTTEVETLATDAVGGLRIDFGGGDVLFVENFLLADFDATDVLL